MLFRPFWQETSGTDDSAGRKNSYSTPLLVGGANVIIARLRSIYDHGSADDLAGDVAVHFALIAEGRHVRIVRCQSFMTRPHPEIMKDGVCRDRPLLQIHRVRRQVRSRLACLHLLALEYQNYRSTKKSAEIL